MAGRRGNSVERYYESKRKKRKARKRRLYFWLIVFCIVTFVVLSLTVFFNIRTFQVQGNNIYSVEQIVSALELEEGDNMFRLNKFKLQEELVEKLPYIGSVELYRKLPTTFCIDVQETAARLVAHHKGEFVLMNQDLKVLEVRKSVPKDVTYLIGCNLKEYTLGKTAIFEKETTPVTISKLIEALYEKFDPVEISAIDITELHALRVYYDHHRIKMMFGNSESLGDKVQMAENAITQNGVTEKARIDITRPDAAYYRVINEEDIDDVEGMLLGTAEAKEEKSYQTSDQTDENGENTDEKDEKSEENEEN